MATSAASAGDIPLDKQSVSALVSTSQEEASPNGNVTISLDALKNLLSGADQPPAAPPASAYKWMMPAANAVLLAAGVFLVLGFIALYIKLGIVGVKEIQPVEMTEDELEDKTTEPTSKVGVIAKKAKKGVAKAAKKAFRNVQAMDKSMVGVTFLFLISGALWLSGFTMVVFALETLPVPMPLYVMLPLYLKVFASAFFVIGPMTSLLSGSSQSLGLKWSNLVGIILFHVGNMMTLGFGITAFSADKDQNKDFRSHNGGLTLQHIFYTLGTTLLLGANYRAFEQIQGMQTTVFQILGSLLLLVGCSMAVHADLNTPKAK